MQTLLNEAPTIESNGAYHERAPERKLTMEELIDLVGASATKGDHLTHAEREVYAWQLVNLMHPDMPGLNAQIVEMLARTKEERAALAAKSAKFGRPADTPPPGKTWQDMVIGQWPGDETDEEIMEFLEEIS